MSKSVDDMLIELMGYGWTGRDIINNGITPFGKKYYVDSVNGSDDYTGESPDKPKATIQSAVDRSRYKSDGSTIDSDKDHMDTIFIRPGHYNEQVLFSGYNIKLIGLGCQVPGKDYGVSINYDGAIDTTAVVAFSGSGITLKNLHIYCAEAIPAVYCAGGDNNLIENCVIECDGTNCTYGMQMASMKGSWIKNVVIRTPKTAGIWCEGGSNHYCIDGGIVDVKIYGAATGVKGVLIDNTNTCYNFEVTDCKIDVLGGGSTSIAIDNNATGNIIISENKVVCHASSTAIESAGKGILHNYVSKNGTVTDPFDDD